jgi:DNA-binding MarR family transcriptional regulator
LSVQKKQQQHSIGYLLISIGKRRRNKSNALLALAGIHSGQDILLYYLSADDGQTISELVDKMNIKHPTIFTMVNRMEAVGLLRKEKDANDKRASRVTLTEKGKQAAGKVVGIWRTIEATTLEGLDGEEQKTLVSLLQKINDNLK